MSDLLPANATEAERALSESMGRIGDVPVVVREVWNPDTVPVNALPWLAWAFSVDNWDTNWTEQQKRDTIKQAIPSQRIKGTIGAVKAQLAALGLDIQIQEWFNQIPQGAPYTFQLIITSSQAAVTDIGINKILDIVNTNKNLRSHLDKISVIAASTSNVTMAAVSMLGTEISVTNYERAISILNDFVLPQNNISIGA